MESEEPWGTSLETVRLDDSRDLHVLPSSSCASAPNCTSSCTADVSFWQYAHIILTTVAWCHHHKLWGVNQNNKTLFRPNSSVYLCRQFASVFIVLAEHRVKICLGVKINVKMYQKYCCLFKDLLTYKRQYISGMYNSFEAGNDTGLWLAVAIGYDEFWYLW